MAHGKIVRSIGDGREIVIPSTERDAGVDAAYERARAELREESRREMKNLRRRLRNAGRAG